MKKLRPSAVDEVNVHPSVIVIVQKGTTGSQCFWKVSLRRHRVLVRPDDAALVGAHLLEDLSRRLPGHTRQGRHTSQAQQKLAPVEQSRSESRKLIGLLLGGATLSRSGAEDQSFLLFLNDTHHRVSLSFIVLTE